jgi:hypothetical protein
MLTIGCKNDDMSILTAKKFIIPFEAGIVVIKHWKIHNYIQKDRYNETKYKELKGELELDENGAYTKCVHDVHGMDTQVRLELGKDRDRIESEIEKESDSGIFKTFPENEHKILKYRLN